MRFVGILGILAILGIAYAMSTDRKAIKPKLVAWGLGIQFGLALFILKTPVGQGIFKALGDIVSKILHYSDDGASFVFGSLVTDLDTFGFIFAFKVLPAIIFVGALMNIAYYLGIMQFVVSMVAKLMVKTLGTSGAESLSAVGTVFVGQSEAPLLI
ncbi:MAG: Na+ dependent nucleoside transporter N-terminal domain-containing protein, partial [Vulcanimicrobiota bacterium]